MAISREEQLRNNRRFSRQVVGAVAPTNGVRLVAGGVNAQ